VRYATTNEAASDRESKEKGQEQRLCYVLQNTNMLPIYVSLLILLAVYGPHAECVCS
jgi:hypothetical protein